MLSDPQQWNEAAETLGLEITCRTRWLRRPSRLIGSFDGFPVDIDYDVSGYSQLTTIHLFLPPGPWDESMFMVFAPPDPWHSTVRARMPDAYPTTGDTEFDSRLAVSARGGHANSAQRFLTARRRKALLALHREIPEFRFGARPRNDDLLLPTSLSSQFKVNGWRWQRRRSGRMPGTQIVDRLRAMAATGQELVDSL